MSEIKKEKKKLHWLTKLLFVIDFIALICFFVAYGPWSVVREYLVTTALGTGHHKHFAYVLYSEEYVKEIVAVNNTIDAAGKTDVSQIEFVDYSDLQVYENIYEEQILKKDEGNDLYKIFEIKEDSYSGYCLVVYQPERLSMVMSPYFNGAGVSTMCRLNNALVGVNGSGYLVSEDNGIFPMDNLIVDGKIYYDTKKVGKLIGMNKDGVLMLMQATCQQAIDAGMVWAVEFGPYLIVNGEEAVTNGNSGGYQPRTAIGQRKDGIVVIFVIDGRGGNGSNGATFADLIELFRRYNCYNAANLDGGGSSTIVENGKVLNNPVSYQGAGERHVLDAIILK